MAIDILPRTTKTDPWDLVQAFSDQQGKTNMYAERDARNAEALPVEQALAIAKLKAQSDLGVDAYGQKLQMSEPFEERTDQRRAGIARENYRVQSDVDVDKADRLEGKQFDRWKILKKDGNDDFYTRGRNDPASKTPDTPTGYDGVMLPSDLDKLRGSKPKMEGYEVGDPIVFNGKQYFPYKKAGTQTTPDGPANTPGVTTKSDKGTMPNPSANQPGVTNGSVSDPSLKSKPYQKPGLLDSLNPFKSSANDAPVAQASYKGSDGPADFQDGNSEPNIINETYDSLRKAGLNHRATIAFMGEVGRENNFDPDLIFGSHGDPANRVRNTGLISWQGGRRNQMLSYLDDRGLLDNNGNPLPSKAALDAMAEFAVQKEMPNQMRSYLNRDDLDYGDAAKVLGKDFIGWRYRDPQYTQGHQNRDTWRNSVERYIKNPDTKQKPQVQATDDPDIFNVILGA